MSSREPPRVLPFRSRLRDDKDLDSGQTYDPPAEHLISTVMPSKIHPNPQELIKRSLIWPGVLSPRERTFKAQATLPTEILELIFEELQKSSSLANVRLVSVQFNEIATPIAYRQVTLTDQILASFSLSKYLFDHTISQLRVAHDVRFYTRHISIDRCLDKDLLKELLRSMKDIRNVTWSQWDQGPRGSAALASSDQSIQSYEVFRALRSRFPDLVYSVQNLDITSLHAYPLSTLPTSSLVSCKFAEWVDPDNLSGGRAQVLELLLGRSGLETLHLVSKNDDATFPDHRIKDDQRLPAIKELVLNGYRWQHSPEVAVHFWDWSRVTHLELAKVSIIRFLQTVKPENLLRLQYFCTDGHCLSEVLRGQASALMSKFVGQIHALVKLGLTCHFSTIKGFPEIAKHGHSLHSLYLRDYEGIFCAEQFSRSPGSPAPVLATLHLSCLGLMELATDFCSETEPIETIKLIAKFRNLRRLVLFSRKWFRNTRPDEATLQTNQLAARTMILPLVRTKEGAKFENVVVSIEMFLMEGIFRDEHKRDAAWFGVYTHTYGRSKRTIEGDFDCYTGHRLNENERQNGV